MAEDITDVYVATEAGDAGWQSLSALAAEQVDAKLPIESDDGTVRLDSPKKDTFTVSAGNVQALYLTRTSSDADQLVIGDRVPGLQGGVGAAGLHIQGVTAAEIKSTTDASGHLNTDGGVITYANTGWVLRDRESGGGFLFQINPSGLADSSLLNALSIAGVDGQFRIGYQGTENKPAFTFYSDLDTGFSNTDADEISILTGGSASLIVHRLDVSIPGELQTPRVVGPAADSDASIELGANLTVSTGGTAIEVWKKGTANPIYVTPRPDVNNFKGVRYRTYAGAAAGSSVVAALSVNDSIDATVLSSFCAEPAFLNGSGTLDELRGYFAQDGGGIPKTYKAFTSDVKDRRNEADEADRCATWLVYGSGSAPSYFGGNIQAPSVSGLADTDASIELGTNAVIKSETGYVGLNSNQNGWNNKLNVTGNNFIYNTGTINQNTIRYVKELDGTQTQVVREGVYGLTTTVNDWGAQEGHTIFQNLVGPHVIEAKETIRLITQKTSSDPNVTNPTAGIYLVCSGPDVQQAQLTTAQCGVVCIDTSVQLQTQSSPNSSRRTRFTVKDQGVVSEVDIKTPSVSAPASDASIELGTELLTSNHTPTQPNSIATKQTVDDKIWVGTTAEYQAISQKNPTTLYCLTD